MLRVRMNQGVDNGGGAPAPVAPTAPAAPAAPALPSAADIVGGLKMPGGAVTPFSNTAPTATTGVPAASATSDATTANPNTTGDVVQSVLAQTRATLFGQADAAPAPPTPSAYAPVPAPAPAPAAATPAVDPAVAQQIEALQAENDKLRQAVGLQRAKQFRLPDEIRASLGANRPEGASGVEGLEYILGAAVQTTEERLREYYENRFAELEKRLAPVQETLEQQRAREQHEQAVQSATAAINTAIAPLMADPAAKWLFDENNAGHPVVVQFGQELGRFGHECIQGRGVIEENGRRFSVPAGPINPMILQHYAAQMLQRYRAYVPGGAPVANPSAIDGAQSLAGGAPMNGRNVQGAPQSVSLRDALTPGARGRLLRN